jgi:hypothetical protein
VRLAAPLGLSPVARFNHGKLCNLANDAAQFEVTLGRVAAEGAPHFHGFLHLCSGFKVQAALLPTTFAIFHDDLPVAYTHFIARLEFSCEKAQAALAQGKKKPAQGRLFLLHKGEA